MQCQTIQPGAECTFWSKQGCIFDGNQCPVSYTHLTLPTTPYV